MEEFVEEAADRRDRRRGCLGKSDEVFHIGHRVECIRYRHLEAECGRQSLPVDLDHATRQRAGAERRAIGTVVRGSQAHGGGR